MPLPRSFTTQWRFLYVLVGVNAVASIALFVYLSRSFPSEPDTSVSLNSTCTLPGNVTFADVGKDMDTWFLELLRGRPVQITRWSDGEMRAVHGILVRDLNGPVSPDLKMSVLEAALDDEETHVKLLLKKRLCKETKNTIFEQVAASLPKIFPPKLRFYDHSGLLTAFFRPIQFKEAVKIMKSNCILVGPEHLEALKKGSFLDCFSHVPTPCCNLATPKDLREIVRQVQAAAKRSASRRLFILIAMGLASKPLVRRVFLGLHGRHTVMDVGSSLDIFCGVASRDYNSEERRSVHCQNYGDWIPGCPSVSPVSTKGSNDSITQQPAKQQECDFPKEMRVVHYEDMNLWFQDLLRGPPVQITRWSDGEFLALASALHHDSNGNVPEFLRQMVQKVFLDSEDYNIKLLNRHWFCKGKNTVLQNARKAMKTIGAKNVRVYNHFGLLHALYRGDEFKAVVNIIKNRCLLVGPPHFAKLLQGSFLGCSTLVHAPCCNKAGPRHIQRILRRVRLMLDSLESAQRQFILVSAGLASKPIVKKLFVGLEGMHTVMDAGSTLDIFCGVSSRDYNSKKKRRQFCKDFGSWIPTCPQTTEQVTSTEATDVLPPP